MEPPEFAESGRELSGYDVPFLEAELGRLRSGLAYWQARRNRPGTAGPSRNS